MRLEIFANAKARTAELAWVIQGALKTGLRFEAVVSARRAVPRVLLCVSTNNCAAFSANVAPFPAAAPRPTPCPVAPITPGGTGTASVWWTGGTRAEGPNARCHRGSSSKAEPLGPTEADTPFFWCNFMRDFFRAFGFESELHGFEGDDPIRTRRYTQRLELCAECLLDSDGHDIYLDFYDSPYAGGTHAAVDPSIVIHEYTHAVSSRLLGGVSITFPFWGVQGEGLDEGYSDYFALTVLDFLRRQSGVPSSSLLGAGFEPGGIRDYATVGKWTPALTDEYEIGKVWCAALLEARNALAPPLDAADRLMWQALVLSLKSMSPICASGGCLTLAHAKDALMTSLSKFGVGASQLASVASAFQGRNL
jgi:hypothetical protein